MQRNLDKYLAAVGFCIITAGCASKPIVDTYNVDMVQYQKDLAQCEDIAEQVQAGTITAKSTAFGAGVGAAYGAVSPHRGVGTGAATGAVAGASGGLLKSDNEKAKVTKNCLRYRGYAVLN